MNTNQLYAAQDKFLNLLGNIDNIHKVGGEIILCGGTALARQYVHHRVSYDLDFFLNKRFNPIELLRLLGSNGIVLENIQTEHERFVTQCFGVWSHQGTQIKISFIEDSFPDMFSPAHISFTDTTIKTEEIDGLYHRKLRTITGISQSDVPQSGRQTARDIFDLFVLDQSLETIPMFIKNINDKGANFPDKAFIHGIGAMPWLDLMDEFQALDIEDPIKASIGLDFNHSIMGDIRNRFNDIILEVSADVKNFKP